MIDDTFAVKVRGSILMTREMITHRGDYGRIINISTDASQVFAGQIAYGASKATLEALTSKRSDFLRFYLYLRHVIDDFACLELQH